MPPWWVNQLSDQFYYPFESQYLHHLPPATTDLHQMSSPVKMVEQVPPPTRRCKVRSASSMEQERATKNQESSTMGYILVRARRGQATDSHSLAERVRREKISERMQTLQSLVPGCDKVTGKALKLDQIINYIQLLQTQVQYLSMKLASISTINNDEMYEDHTKEVHEHEHELLDSSNWLQQVQSLFTQDDQTLTQNPIDFDSYELSNALCKF